MARGSGYKYIILLAVVGISNCATLETDESIINGEIGSYNFKALSGAFDIIGSQPDSRLLWICLIDKKDICEIVSNDEKDHSLLILSIEICYYKDNPVGEYEVQPGGVPGGPCNVDVAWSDIHKTVNSELEDFIPAESGKIEIVEYNGNQILLNVEIKFSEDDYISGDLELNRCDELHEI